MPVFEAGCVLSHDGDQAEVLIPTTAGSYGLIGQGVLWLLNACGLMRSGHRLEGHVEGLQTLLGQLQSQFGTHSTSFQFIGAAVRAETRDLQVEAEVLNTDGRLRPGLFAEARLALPPQTAITIPANAVRADGAAGRTRRLRPGLHAGQGRH